MKSGLMIAASLLLLGPSAFACAKPEAQFIGKVTATSLEKRGCFIQIGHFTSYQESGVCPLDSYAASSAWFADQSCKLSVGNPISGYVSTSANGELILD